MDKGHGNGKPFLLSAGQAEGIGSGSFLKAALSEKVHDGVCFQPDTVKGGE